MAVDEISITWKGEQRSFSPPRSVSIGREESCDVVIDNPTMRPRWVREAAAAVKGRAGQYIFISTISVYAANDTPGADEAEALATTTTPDLEDGDVMRLYGPLKALSEQEAQKAFPGKATIVRPGCSPTVTLIVRSLDVRRET